MVFSVTGMRGLDDSYHLWWVSPFYLNKRRPRTFVAIYYYQAHSTLLLDHMRVLDEGSNGSFRVMNVHTFLAFRENIFVNSVSIRPENCLLSRVHLQGPPPMPSLSWSLCWNVVPMCSCPSFSLSSHDTYCLFLCFRHWLHLIWGNHNLCAFLTHKFPEHQSRNISWIF